MAVVDVQELHTRHGQLAGWSVVEWDGYVESSVTVPVHKGEPDTPVDPDARAGWEAWAAERERAKWWAGTVWRAARWTNFTPEVGDDLTVRLTMPAGTLAHESGHPVTVLLGPLDYEYPIRVISVDERGRFEFRLMSEQFPALSDGMMIMLRYLATRPSFTPDALTRRRQRAVRDHVPGDELWNLVFAWPENEWDARWGMFVDGIREDRWGWGDAWVRTGDHLAGADWKPPHPLADGLVKWWTPTREDRRQMTARG